MLRKRWYLFPIIGVFVITLILGSFFDLQINTAIYDRYNGFGLFMAAFGETPVYLSFGILGFGFFFLFKKFENVWIKVLLVVGIVGTLGCCIYFQGKHIFDVNGYNNKSLYWLGYLIAFFIYCIGFGLGYLLFKNTNVEAKKILFILLTLIVIEGLTQGVNQLTKIFMSRPRFRLLAELAQTNEYRNWWENGKAFRDSILGNNTTWPGTDVLITKEEFKSFPSGHMTNTFVMLPVLVALPMLNPNFKVKQEILIAISFVWCGLLAYSRMLVGAHFLSDVSVGSLVTLVLYFVINEIYIKLDRRFFPQAE